MIRSNARRGFTLIEMLVTMALIATLAAMAMVVAPGIMDKDRSVDAVTNLQGWLQISQARAQRDRLPRGVRLIVDPNKSSTTSPEAPNPLFVTEAQYIESPPVFVPNPTPNATTNAGAYVQFDYTIAPTATPSVPQGAVTGRTCTIAGLTQEQATQIQSYASQGASLWMPVLGTWHQITGSSAPSGSGSNYSVAVTLFDYPDAQLGASTSYRTYHFGIYGPPRALLGEPTMQLPTNTCVDLSTNVSSPAGVATSDYNILFAPNGHLAYTASTQGAGHVFLVVREPRKALKLGITMDFTNLAAIQQGGEMMIVAIKAKSGAIAVAPVDQSGDPYALAKQAVAGP